MERERELAEKYRDRARERRDGVNKDYEETELISTTANYRAVGPTAEAWVMRMLTLLVALITWGQRPCVFIFVVCSSEISLQQRNVVSWSRSLSSWEVTWSTLTWWKVWILLCCRRWDMVVSLLALMLLCRGTKEFSWTDCVGDGSPAEVPSSKMLSP